MTTIQKKSLQHVSETLGSFDTLSIYNALIDAMTEACIDNAVRTEIAGKYEAAMSEQSKKLRTAKDWIGALIADVK